jgi:hypothetical protein
MASSIYSVFVNLAASTSDFVNSMNTASSAARKAGRDITDSFSGLSSALEKALTPFGQLGPQIAQALGAVGESVAGASNALAKMGQGMTGLTVVAGTGIGVLGAIAASAAALTAKTAESAAGLYNLSQSTGVSVEALSALNFVAKQSGVSADAMALGLERMSKSAFAAATAPAGAINAYTRLKIALTDNGQLRSTIDIFKDVADALARLGPGYAQSALAQEIFSRAGAGLLPVLNRGSAGIQELIAKAQQLGVVMDSQTAQAAAQFEEKLGEISAAAQGLSNRLTRDLLPSLQVVANQLENGFTGSGASTLLRDIEEITKGAIELGETMGLLYQQISVSVDQSLAVLTAFGQGVFKVLGDIVAHNFNGMVQDSEDAYGKMGAAGKKFLVDSGAAWTSWHNAIIALNYKAPHDDTYDPNTGKKKGDGGTDVSPTDGRNNAIAETITKLLAQQQQEAALANAIGDVASNTILATAAAEASNVITELQIRAARQHRDVTADEKSAITDIITLTAAYKAGYADNKEIENFIIKTRDQSSALQDLAQAYAHGEAAVEAAKENEKIQPFETDASTLSGIIQALESSPTASGLEAKIQSIHDALAKTGKDKEIVEDLQQALDALHTGGDPFASLKNSLDQLIAKIRTLKVGELAEFSGQAAKATGESVLGLTHEIDDQLRYNQAVIDGADALRRLAIEQQLGIQPEKRQLGAFQDRVSTLRSQGVPDSDPDLQKAQGNVQLQQQYISQLDAGVGTVDAAQQKAAADQAVSSLLSFKNTQDQIAGLQLLANAENETADRIVAAQLAIKQASEKSSEEQQQYLFDLANASAETTDKMYQFNQKLVEQWDSMADDIGSLGDRFKELGNKIALEGQNIWKSVFDALHKTVDGMEDDLAKFVVTGKGNFKELFESLEEDLLKAGIQKGLSSIVTGVFGSGVASAARSEAARTPGFAPDSSQKSGGLLSWIGGIFGAGKSDKDKSLFSLKADGTQTSPFYVILVDSSGQLLNFGKGLGPGAGQQGPAGTANAIGSLFGATDRWSGTNLSHVTVGSTSAIGSLFNPVQTTLPQPQQQGGSSQASTTNLVTELSKVFKDLTSTLSSLFKDLASVLKDVFSAGGSVLKSIFSIFGKASGGQVSSGRTYIVGEQRPEIFIPDAPSVSAGSSKASFSNSSTSVFGRAFAGIREGSRISTTLPYVIGEKGAELFSPEQPGTILPSISSVSSSTKILGQSFGGYRALGGEVAPGRTYVVGERQAEVFMPAGGSSVSKQISSISSSAATSFLGRSFSSVSTTTRSASGQSFLVGERGSELFSPKERGTIIPNISSLSASVNVLGKPFGGFREMGGAVDPMSSYIVGERGPERFVPQGPGSIVPSAGGTHSSESAQNINVQMHVHGVQNVDQFKKSQSQIAAELHRTISFHSRRG